MLLNQIVTSITRRKPVTVLQTIAALKARQLRQKLSHHDSGDNRFFLPTDEQCRAMLMIETKHLKGLSDDSDDGNIKGPAPHKNKNSSPSTLAPALLEVRTSNIPNSGRGVFISNYNKNNYHNKKCIPAGTILATYGGMYIPPVPIVGSPYFGHPPKLLIPMGGDYVYCCENGGWIDGKSDMSFLSKFPEQTSMAQQSDHDVAQFANHSSKPNAITVTLFDYPQNIGVYSPPVGTPWYHCTDSNETVSIPEKVRLKGVVLVSLEDLHEGDEVYFDYGINPPESRPDWYKPPMNDYGAEECGYYLREIFEGAMEEIGEIEYRGKN